MFVAVTHAIAGALDSGSVHFGQSQVQLVLEYCLIACRFPVGCMFWRGSIGGIRKNYLQALPLF